MSRDDLIQLEGVVIKVLGYGTVEIECENNKLHSKVQKLMDRKRIEQHTELWHIERNVRVTASSVAEILNHFVLTCFHSPL